MPIRLRLHRLLCVLGFRGEGVLPGQEIASLAARVKALLKQVYGRKSEKVDLNPLKRFLDAGRNPKPRRWGRTERVGWQWRWVREDLRPVLAHVHAGRRVRARDGHRL